jgi:hypothetical protein
MTHAGGAKAAHEERETKHTNAPTGVQPVEPDDASRSGDHHAEQHEHLRRNVAEGQAQRHPETPAGQHATGSFTGRTGKGTDREKP